MADVGDIAAVCSLLGGLVALVFAAIIWRANPHGRRNRHLALLMVAEALFQGTVILSFWGSNGYVEFIAQWVAITILSAAFLLFCTTLEGPFARALSRRAVRVAIVAVCAVVLADSLIFAAGVIRRGEPASTLEDSFGWPWPLFAVASLVSLVVSLNAYASTPAASALRRKARAYALAFGLRDVLYAAVIAWWAFAEYQLRSPAAAEVSSVVSGLTTILFVAFLTYGILSTQLFDVDLKIKVGISRSTVVTFGIVAVLGALKTVEYSFNRTFGAIAAGLVAGIVLVLAPRLNRLGDKVANAAMPAVQPTSEYVAYKKLEVYRAAIESAIEGDGKIDRAERAMLDRLRAKLGLSEADAAALEAELGGVTA